MVKNLASVDDTEDVVTKSYVDAQLAALPQGILGETKRLSAFATSSSSFTNLGTLAVSTNVTAGRKLKVSMSWVSSSHTVSDGRIILAIFDDSGNEFQSCLVRPAASNTGDGGSFFDTVAPSSGAETYRIKMRALDGGTGTINGSSVSPIVLLVEDIGEA